MMNNHDVHDGSSNVRNVMNDFLGIESHREACRYQIESVIGEGAYGVVCSAKDNKDGRMVAVKRMKDVFKAIPEAVRILRELKFDRILTNHENIVSITDVMLPRNRMEFHDVYAVFELFPSDLYRVLRAKVPLSAEHIRWIMYQIVRAVFYIHSANIFHRDLKPSNVLLNEDCDVRVCDFGLARAAFDNAPDLLFWTDYVATRWYRAPELILSYYTSYSTAIDVWAIGCIFAEILGHGRPLFPGKSANHQLELFVSVIGSPSPASIQHVRDERARAYLVSLGRQPPKGFETLFPDAHPLACDLLKGLLEWNPDLRLTAQEALRHPYFSGIHDVSFERTAQPVDPQEFAFEQSRLSVDLIKEEFLKEIVQHYHPEAATRFYTASGQILHESGGHHLEQQSAADRFRQMMRNKELGYSERNLDSMPNYDISGSQLP
uniref:Mitogen-activated protein kinase n=1 Tax=Timspurckia oligopyrenoides TaxID=708627 RepID=A0A7S0ZBR0_9RHOD|mmetsp:Transcript_11620/g.21036  ORF Transcript_11620/g.21036 Transcript_11620/m.21036 type:complete len:434 (+) Transcript_11620:58-1359(+)